MKHRVRIGFLLIATYWLGLFIVTHIPNPQAPLSVHIWDKAEHFLAYALLALLLCIGFQANRGPARRRYLGILATVVAYAALDELLQSPVPGRHPDLLDWFADTLGAIFAMGLHFITTRCLSRKKYAKTLDRKPANSEPVRA